MNDTTLILTHILEALKELSFDINTNYLLQVFMVDIFEAYIQAEQQDKNDLHYLTGINCYQHASGFSSPILLCDSLNYDHMRLLYYSLMPAPLSFPFRNPSRSIEEFNDRIFLCCEEEGLIILNGNFEQNQGYRTLAVFSGEVAESDNNYDFHFAFFNESQQWEEKVPFEPAQTDASIHDIELKRNKKFVDFVLIPENYKPSILDSLDYVLLNLGTEESPKEIVVLRQTEILRQLPFLECVADPCAGVMDILRMRVPAPPLGQIMMEGLHRRDHTKLEGLSILEQLHI